MSSHSKSRWSDLRKKTRSQKRHRKHRHGRNYEDEYEFENDDSRYALDDDAPKLLSREEHLYRDARMFAEDRAELFLRAGKRAVIVLLLLVVIPPLGFVAAIFWAAKYGRRLFAMTIEPRLRERLVEDQVSRHIHANLSQERRKLADEHSHSLEVLSASIAHEIRNPITAAKSLLQQMREDPEAVDNEEYAQVALAELERVERSISHLLRFGRDEEVRKNRILMRDVLDSALETFRERGEREQVEIRRVFDCEGAMRGDAEKLRRVMINLVGNAFDALADAQVDEPVIEVSMGENLAGSEVWVKIRDNGFGIDAETRDQIFAPFYTSKSGGTGLGLAITKKLVDAHQGSIEVAGQPGEGAEFVLVFPKQMDGGNGDPLGGRA
ncbi:MAG: HAMP domain-containing histidine kinase [Myxococcales bacterium]|nr:HAMP domain-containing histidine kinase [Myxococcales bacterium]